MRDLALTKLHSVIQFLEINTEDIPQEKTRILKIGALLVNAKYWGESWLKTQHLKTIIMASSPITSWQIDGETMETVRLYFLGAPKSLQMVIAGMNLNDACSLEEKL